MGTARLLCGAFFAGAFLTGTFALTAFSATTFFTAIDDIFRDCGVEINTVLECETVPTLCEFVSAGLGVALTHPLCVIDMVDHLDVRPFKPEIPSYFHFCHARSPANMELVEEYKKCVLAVASEAASEMLRPD
jgi:DNA-binding transcriptional LysR family regulator